MNVLGISCYFHDSAACLVVDGTVVAYELESAFSGVAHDNVFPIHAIRRCLEKKRLTPASLDAVVFYEKPIVKFSRILHQHLATFPRSRRMFAASIGSWFDYKMNIKKTLMKEVGFRGPVLFVEHHLSHVAHSFYQSGFEKSVIVTLDGVGEWATTSVGICKEAKLRIDREIHFPHSLGLLYSALTAYLGFAVNDEEGKVMMLSKKGNPKKFRKQFQQLIRTFPDGSFSLSMEYFRFTWSDRMYGRRFEQLFGYPTRMRHDPVRQYHADIAAALQERLEQVIFQLLHHVYKKYKIANLCMAGGVAQNALMRNKVCRRTPFKKLFVPQYPGDAGGAIGAALYIAHSHKR